MDNAVLKNLRERRSIRKYKKEQISEEQLDAVLEAGIYAPTGMGAQSPMIVVIQDPDTIAKISAMNAAVMGTDSDPFYGAPTLLIVLADRNRPTHVEDGSLVMGNLLNAAYSVGVDSCWIHRAKEFSESAEGREMLRRWGVPDEYIGIGNCILGYRDCDYPAPKPRKSDYIRRV
jgi:nitroreductase